jgi:hypothetical protein
LRANTRQRKFVQIALENATSYDDWARAAHELDDLDGKDASTFSYTDRSLLGRNAWKEDPKSPAYDHKSLRRRLKQLREARTAGDLTRILFLLRISLSRNFAHTGNPEVTYCYYKTLTMQLYNHTNIGTKRVVEDYISEVQEALQFLLRVESPLVSDAHKLDQLTCLRQVLLEH